MALFDLTQGHHLTIKKIIEGSLWPRVFGTCHGVCSHKLVAAWMLSKLLANRRLDGTCIHHQGIISYMIQHLANYLSDAIDRNGYDD